MENQLKFLKLHLNLLPNAYQSSDCSRLTIAYFIIESLSIINEIDNIIDDDQRLNYIKYIYDCQLPLSNGGGFRGSLFMGQLEYNENFIPPYDCSNLAMTYSALLLLGLLRDDFKRLDKEGILKSIKDRQVLNDSCNNNYGSFCPLPSSSECDIRMVYCACAISEILNDFSSINIPATLSFISNCRSYDGSYSQTPNGEGQGGTTYCALASLELINNHLCKYKDNQQTPQLLSNDEIDESFRWLIHRQNNGFSGRINKVSDSCYSFWCRGALKSLQSLSLNKILNFNDDDDIHFLLSCGVPLGGFSKYPNSYPDVLHNCLTLSALALTNESTRHSLKIKSINPLINVEESTYEYMKSKLH